MLQFVALVATVLLIAGLYFRPVITLKIFWNLIIPLVPITFLITPIIWRSLCPLATLNMLLNGRLDTRVLPSSSLAAIGGVGLILLGILVPARRFLFNENAMALIILVVLIAVAALVLGAYYDAKAGFCNAICPVLPVEKLYGQHPIWKARNPRCGHCMLCTPKGCIDIAPTKSIKQAIGKSLHSHGWLKTSYGFFAAAFPGFITGFFTIADGPFATGLETYLHVTLWTVASFLITVIIVLALKVSANRMLPILAAVSIGLYYWFAVPGTISLFSDEAGSFVLIFRTLILAFVGFWLARAQYQIGQTGLEKPGHLETNLST